MGINEIAGWDELSDRELKSVLRDVILGRGMGGSSQYLSFKKSYYDHASEELQSRISLTLAEMMDEVNPKTVTVGGRAIEVCAEIQSPEMLKKIDKITKTIPSHLDFIESAPDLDSCVGLFEYIADFNKVAGQLRLESARPVLLRQTSICSEVDPEPLTKEYFQHHMCCKSALAALERFGDTIVE
jgi:hypothetical protein